MSARGAGILPASSGDHAILCGERCAGDRACAWPAVRVDRVTGRCYCAHHWIARNAASSGPGAATLSAPELVPGRQRRVSGMRFMRVPSF